VIQIQFHEDSRPYQCVLKKGITYVDQVNQQVRFLKFIEGSPEGSEQVSRQF